MKQLKEVKIKDGKFTLEGRVVEAKPIGLYILDFGGGYHDISLKKLDEKIANCKERLKNKNPKSKKFEDLHLELMGYIKKKKKVLSTLDILMAREANAYTYSAPIWRESTGGWGNAGTFGYCYYPVLYLKIKEEGKSSGN